MSFSFPDSKTIPPDLKDGDRGPFFSFEGLVKLEPAIHGNVVPNAKLVDESPFECTVYTDSINRVSNLVRKFENPKFKSHVCLNIENPVLIDANSDKLMETDVGTESNPNEQDTYGSILDLNPNYSIAALVEEFNKDINLFCQWGDSDQLHTFWNNMNNSEKEKLLLGLKFKLVPDPEFESNAEKVVKSMKSVQNIRKRNKMLSSWSKLDLKQKVRMVKRLGASKIHVALLKSVKKETSATKEVLHVNKEHTVRKKTVTEPSIGPNRVKNAVKSCFYNPDNIPTTNKIIDLDVEKLSASPENDKFEFKRPLAQVNTIVPTEDDHTKEEEGGEKAEEKGQKSYADMVGKKKKGEILFTIIKKDPNLKPGEVEMPMEDILKGSEPFNLTLYGYFIEKRVNFFNMNKYALSKWKNYGIEKVMVNGEGFYFFKFSNEQGLKEVLDGGPWLVFDNPIIIRRWKPGLNLSKSQGKTRRDCTH